MKKNAAVFLLVLLVAVGSCVIGHYTTGPASEPAVVETIQGNTRRVEEFDSQGRRHGIQRIYENGVLIHENVFEHGFQIKGTSYNPDGSILNRFEEGRDYQLIPDASNR